MTICPSSLTSSKRTETRFETPDSCMVTPYSVVATGHRLFGVRHDDELRPGQKLLQHADEPLDVGFVERGVDFVQHAERAGPTAEDCQQQATQVSVFSPPLSSEMLRGSLPGGRATISMPLSRMSTPSSSTMSAWPPPKSLRNKLWKCPLTVSSVSANSRRLSALILPMICSSEVLGLGQDPGTALIRLSSGSPVRPTLVSASRFTLPMLLSLRRSSAISASTSSR